LALATFRLFVHLDAIFAALLSVSLVILGIVLFVIGVSMKQGNMIQRELWILQRHQLATTKAAETRLSALSAESTDQDEWLARITRAR
jgi:hypothetical protein